MRHHRRLSALGLCAADAAVLALAGWAAVICGARRWASGSALLHAALSDHQLAVSPPVFSAKELVGLPAPVMRYFETVLTQGQSMVASARLRQTGRINMRDAGNHWRHFSAVQRVVARRPGFDRDARIAIAPGVSVRVHDAYVAGEGQLRAAVLGLFSVAHTVPSAALSEAELMRFLAEAVWLPTALLPSQGVVWAAVDAQSATATLQDSGHCVRLLFHFQTDGLVDSVRAEARTRLVDGVATAAPWHGRFRHAAARGGMMVPLAAEVAWLLPDGEHCYWQGQITRADYTFQT